MAKILVVDDAKIMRANIKKMLMSLGHTITGEGGTGYEGIEAYKLFKPDIVTMDITMPPDNQINDGIDAVKGILAYDPDAKIVMVTSHGEQDKVIKAIKAGAKNYVLKPLKVDKLEEVINKLLA
ncbi:MAG: response regulator [Campylobacterota bacterium]|nr:response regulator [Campylobacterota bacterium]